MSTSTFAALFLALVSSTIAQSPIYSGGPVSGGVPAYSGAPLSAYGGAPVYSGVPWAAPVYMPGKGVECAYRTEQCGGAGWNGTTCCYGANECVPLSEWYSVCKAADLPDGVLRENARCGPKYECEPLTECTLLDTPVSLCLTPDDECACSARWEQCGGRDWKGPTCCRGKNACKKADEWYSQCLSTDKHAHKCSAPFEQCGGDTWNGPACCVSGHKCVKHDKWYSQCLKSPGDKKARRDCSCSKLYAQCGGEGWTGASCCRKGECVVQNKFYSQCVPV